MAVLRVGVRDFVVVFATDIHATRCHGTPQHSTQATQLAGGGANSNTAVLVHSCTCAFLLDVAQIIGLRCSNNSISKVYL